jgi:hypothetical protein
LNHSSKDLLGRGKGNPGEQNAAEALAEKGNKREQEAGDNHGRRQQETQAQKEDEADHHPVRRFGIRVDPARRAERLRVNDL